MTFGSLFGQSNSDNIVDTTKNEKIEVVYADLQRSVQMNGGFDRYLEGNVQIIKDSSFFYCDTARLNDLFLKSWGDVSMIKSDSLEVFADSLVYEIDKEEADIYGSVYIRNGDEILFSDYVHFDDKNDIAYYTNKAILRNKTVELKSKRGEFRTKENLALFSQSVSVIDSAFELFADTLLYNTKLNKAIFQGPTDIVLDSANIYCEAGYFLLDDQYGVFRENAKYIGSGDTAIANEIRADGVKNEVEMIGEAFYFSETTYAEGDYIRYNDVTGEVEVKGNGYVKDGEQELRSDIIFYNKETKKFSSEGRTTVQSENNVLTADNIEALDKIGLATGSVVFKDTLNGIRIDSYFLEFDQTDAGKNKAYNQDSTKAILRSILDGEDSLFISADTVYSFDEVTVDSNFVEIDSSWSITIDTASYLTAFYGVRVYNSKFQAVCDSLAYNTKDSILTLFKAPLMWSDTSQFKGDTIKILFRNKTLDQLELFPNSFILNSPDEVFFNQIKGKKTHAYFTDGELDSMEVDGNAQTIYYLQDEKKEYIAVNKTDCSSMMFFFADQLDHIDFETEPTSVMYPMQGIDHNSLKLEGFKWEIDKRPLEKGDLSEKLRYEIE